MSHKYTKDDLTNAALVAGVSPISETFFPASSILAAKLAPKGKKRKAAKNVMLGDELGSTAAEISLPFALAHHFSEGKGMRHGFSVMKDKIKDWAKTKSIPTEIKASIGIPFTKKEINLPRIAKGLSYLEQKSSLPIEKFLRGLSGIHANKAALKFPVALYYAGGALGAGLGYLKAVKDNKK